MRQNKNTSTQPLLLAYLQPHQPASFCYLPAGAATSAEEVKQLSASQIASYSQNSSCIALIAASGLSSFKLELPAGVKANEALLLVEDQLSQPLEELTSVVLSQTGREVYLAVLANEHLAKWEEELTAAGISQPKWQAETLALQQLWPNETPLVFANDEAASLELWLAASLSSFNLPFSWLATNEDASQLNQFLAGLNLTAEPKIHSTNLAAKLCWLAPVLAKQKELWPLSWWQKLLNHPKLSQLSQVKQLANQLLIQLNPYKKQLLPWGLSVSCLLIAGFFYLLQPKQADAHLSQTAAKFENQLGIAITHPQASQKLNQQLTALGEQLSYQQSRLNAWQKLNQLLKGFSATQLTSLELNQKGLTAQLTTNEEELNQLTTQLQQLGGTLTSNNNQINWQLTASELDS